MLSYHHFTLPNGLRVLVHPVPSSKVAIFNLMYKVGSGDESPLQTGIAHLFEHLMFSSSQHVHSYDQALQKVGGQNNAYTTFDVTNYYCVVPSSNLETAFWLESDRMFYLACTPAQLEVQRKVVIEEFNQTCFNKPYGDAWHHLLGLAYHEHPYSWPTIGKEIAHIEGVSLEDVHTFGQHFYRPSNAVLVVTGGVEAEEVKRLSEKWFNQGSPEPPIRYTQPLTPTHQQKGQRKTVQGEVPFNVLYQAYHIPGRSDHAYLALLLLAHLLGTGKSSFLYQKLIDKHGWLTDISVYTTDTLHGGLFVIEAELNPTSDFKKVEEAIQTTIREVCHMEIPPKLWEKAKNQIESEYAFTHMSLFDRADTLAWATWVQSPDFFNQEVGSRLATIQPEEVQKVGKHLLCQEEGIVLCYHKK